MPWHLPKTIGISFPSQMAALSTVTVSFFLTFEQNPKPAAIVSPSPGQKLAAFPPPLLSKFSSNPRHTLTVVRDAGEVVKRRVNKTCRAQNVLRFLLHQKWQLCISPATPGTLAKVSFLCRIQNRGRSLWMIANDLVHSMEGNIAF